MAAADRAAERADCMGEGEGGGVDIGGVGGAEWGLERGGGMAAGGLNVEVEEAVDAEAELEVL